VDPLAALWAWFVSWTTPGGVINGPVVHRADLKRMFSIHDTPWTQAAAIRGLLHLHRRSGDEFWLGHARRLGDAQASRLLPDGRFRWAGHEDDRFSSLVHNALADRALLDLADATGDERYIRAVERNVDAYLVGRLFRPALGGFAMAEVDHYAGRDRFIVNMNSVAADVLVMLDRARGDERHAEYVRTIGERILALQDDDGLPYSDIEPGLHIPLYTALSLRGFAALASVSEPRPWIELARRAVRSLERMQDPDTGLWFHKRENGRVLRFPIFVAGAGIVCNGLLDAADLTGDAVDAPELAARLVRFQRANGSIRNFVGYDHVDNDRRRGDGAESWEDVFATPNWNAQAFEFLCRVLPVPEPHAARPLRRTFALSSRFAYVDSDRAAAVAAFRPPSRAFAAVYVKRRRYGAVLPSPVAVARGIARRRALS
jgi:uncharacterized protein YyaL (SSP411 family)